MKTTDFNGWACARIATPAFEFLIPTEIGPRVMAFRRPGGKNLLYEMPGQQGGRGEAEYRFRGGHRLWHGPEDLTLTYQPDNAAPKLTELKNGRGFVFAGAAEVKTGLRKTLRVELVNERTLKLTHLLANDGPWPVERTAWALTMFRAGGIGIVPFLPKGDHARGDLLPTFSIIPWSYTDFSKPVWKFHRDFLRIDTRRAKEAQKMGLSAYPGWSAYWLDGDLFVKHADLVPGARYPDLGCAFETFCNSDMIELETLSPLTTLAPGQSVEHVEHWGLLSGVSKPDGDEVYAGELLPAVETWLAKARK